MCGCEKHHDEQAECTCICPEHGNFQAAYDLAMRRYDVIKDLAAERDALQADKRDLTVRLDEERRLCDEAAERSQRHRERADALQAQLDAMTTEWGLRLPHWARPVPFLTRESALQCRSGSYRWVKPQPSLVTRDVGPWREAEVDG